MMTLFAWGVRLRERLGVSGCRAKKRKSYHPAPLEINTGKPTIKSAKASDSQLSCFIHRKYLEKPFGIWFTKTKFDPLPFPVGGPGHGGPERLGNRLLGCPVPSTRRLALKPAAVVFALPRLEHGLTGPLPSSPDFFFPSAS
jgi:hypothetical protein